MLRVDQVSHSLINSSEAAKYMDPNYGVDALRLTTLPSRRYWM